MKYKAKGSFSAMVLTLIAVSVIFIITIVGISALKVTPKAVPVAKATEPTLALNAGELTAKAAILYDPTDKKILFQKDADESLPLASLTKLATAETILTQEPNTLPITITQSDLLQQDQGDLILKAGDTLTLSKLIQLGLVASSNDAMAAATESLGPDGVGKLNATASALGLHQTIFYNPTGLDISATTSGAYGSAYDVALLASTFYKQYPSYFELTEKSSVSVNYNGQMLTAAATDAPLLSIPGLVGAKTGYTDLAGGNVVAIFDLEIGHPLVAVVLGSTEKGRFDDIKTMVAAARESL